MRVDRPTPAEIRSEFDYALRQYVTQGQLLPSCVPFNDEVTRALEQIALQGASAARIAAARAALERQLAP